MNIYKKTMAFAAIVTVFTAINLIINPISVFADDSSSIPPVTTDVNNTGAVSIVPATDSNNTGSVSDGFSASTSPVTTDSNNTGAVSTSTVPTTTVSNNTGATSTVAVPPTTDSNNTGSVSDTSSTTTPPPTTDGNNTGAVSDTAPTSTPPTTTSGNNTGAVTGSTTATTTPTTPSNGGGGSTNGVSFFASGGGGGYSVPPLAPGVSAASALSSSTLSCPFMTGYVIPSEVNNPADISKLQVFLSAYEGDSNVSVTGVLDQATINGIIAFQKKYLTQVMGPWGATQASGNAYITTISKINSIVCGSTSALTPAEQAVINTYLTNLANGTSTEITASATNPAFASTTLFGATSTNASNGSTNGSVPNNSAITGNVVSSGAASFFSVLFSKILGWFGVK